MTDRSVRIATLRQDREAVLDEVTRLEAALGEDEAAAALGELPATDLPLALLPVRMETRFVTAEGGDELLVRVYPDDLQVDTHEAALTDDERLWGEAFWEHTWRAGAGTDPTAEALHGQAWRQLAERFDPQRATWIAWTLRPLNGEDLPREPVEDGDPLPLAPRFPERPRREDSWTRAPLVRALPDRWVLFGYRAGVRVLLEWGAPIPASLAAGPDPGAPPPPDTDGHQGLPIDEGMRWLLDFEEALRVGMALRVRLPAGEAGRGFDTLLIVGVCGEADGDEAGDALGELLLAQRYTAGLAFVPHHTPTNNSAEEDSGFSPRDPAAFTVPPPLVPDVPPSGSAGAAAARLLGLPPELVGRLPHAGDDVARDAHAMLAALWPATGGYFLEQMLADTFGPEAIEGARRFTLAFARSRGPTLTLRVGAQPYGLLPVSSLDLWEAREGGEVFVGVLRGLREQWRKAVPAVPRVDRTSGGSDPERNILDVLAGDATSSGWAARPLFDEAMFAFPALHLNAPPFPALEQRRANLRRLLDGLGLDWTPRLLGTVPSRTAFPIEGPGTGEQDGEGATPSEVIDWLRTAPYEAIRDETGLRGGPPRTLLALLLRHSVLTAYASVAFRIQLGAGAVPPTALREPAVVDVMGPTTRTPGRHPDHGLPGLQGRALHTLTSADHPAAGVLDELRTSLDHLRTLSGDVLDRLLNETLDLFAYRLDAWVTSLVLRRLERMRAAKPLGVHLGGFGWLEGVRPAPPRAEAEPPLGEPGPLAVDPGSAGFIHAPSLGQATAAAILRSGALSEQGEDSGLFDLDLSSRRVRIAEWLLDGVRQGQPLGALLGYRFERGLHDRGLARLIAVFRRIAPFGELLKAEAAAERTRAEVDRLRGLGHPEAAAAEAAAAVARKRRDALVAERAALPGRLAAAERDAQQRGEQLKAVDQQIAAIRNQIARSLTMRPPRTTDHLEEQLANQMGRRVVLANSAAEANTRAAHLRARSQAIGSEVAGAERDLQQTTRRANELRTLPHPGLAPAQAAAADAERRYHELLDEHRRTLLFPGDTGPRSLESVAASQVVDGLALLKLWQSGEVAFGSHGLPRVGTSEHAALRAELDALADAVDAVRDALVAESVFQFAQGRPARAGADLDAIAGGAMPPPELEVLRTPRGGAALTHRVLGILDPAAGSSPWPEALASVRAAAEPALNAWAAQLLGDPSRARFQAHWVDPDIGATLGTRVLHLGELPLAPVDLLALTREGGGEGYPEAESLIAYLLGRERPEGVPGGGVVRVDPGLPPDAGEGALSLADLLDLAHVTGTLVAAARPLTDSDLTSPDVQASVTVDAAELRGRADRAEDALRDAARELAAASGGAEAAEGAEALRDALVRVALFGVTDALPEPASPSEALAERARDAERALARRLVYLDAAAGRVDRDTMGAADQRDHDLARMAAIFGPDFRVLPHLRPRHAADVARAFASSLELQGGEPFASTTWIGAMARVRAGVDRLATAFSYAEALGGNATRFEVAQLPLPSGLRWCALPPPADAPPIDDALSLVAFMPSPLDPGAAVVGLWIDEWVEIVPSAEVQTALAFNFDEPAAQPPQAILLAVPPDGRENWELETLEAILLETLDLARLRAVDFEGLERHTELDQALPALFLALNLANDTVSTDFRRVAAARP